jgi:hypothetical protein
VFFTGYGEWWYSTDTTVPFKACCEYKAHGVFRLSDEDEIEYKLTNKLFFSDALFASSHPGSEFLKRSTQDCLLGFNNLAGVKSLPEKASLEDYRFYVDKDKDFSLDILPANLLESERDKLLKQIGVMALVLAEKSNKFEWVNAPNALQIANNAQEILEAGKFQDKKGTSSTEICNSICEGLKLLMS